MLLETFFSDPVFSVLFGMLFLVLGICDFMATADINAKFDEIDRSLRRLEALEAKTETLSVPDLDKLHRTLSQTIEDSVKTLDDQIGEVSTDNLIALNGLKDDVEAQTNRALNALWDRVQALEGSVKNLQKQAKRPVSPWSAPHRPGE